MDSSTPRRCGAAAPCRRAALSAALPLVIAAAACTPAQSVCTQPHIEGSAPSLVQTRDSALSPGATVPDLKVAFVGDLGLSEQSAQVLRLIRDERAHLAVLLGDYDYRDSPEIWEDHVACNLGADYPLLGVVGNHDMSRWPAYRAALEARVARIPGMKCTGELGTAASCTYGGLRIVLSGAGTAGEDHLETIQRELSSHDALWNVCAWHKDQSDMQIGTKGDAVGWGPYRACQAAGAIIVTGHEHSYARTRTLTDIGDPRRDHGAAGPPDELTVAPGKTFVAVSGLGGRSKRDTKKSHAEADWWATVYGGGLYIRNGQPVDSFHYDYGVLFITFHAGADSRRAEGYFKNIRGETIDRFTVTSRLHASTPPADDRR